MTEENGIPFFSNFELAAKREEQTKIFQQVTKNTYVLHSNSIIQTYLLLRLPIHIRHH